jgi:hypothetical protein
MNQSTTQTNNRIAQMLATHPQQSRIQSQQLGQVVQTLEECAAVCTICADACLSEKMVAELVQCIRLNELCAISCEAMAHTIMRSGVQISSSMLRSMLDGCAAACQSCSQECARHAQMHEHCRICAESCRQCEETCRQMLSSM